MSSSFDTTWDVNKYFSPHEPSHHWELRKKFLTQNKDRYPEDRLVCLAQTFANIEFMGCRYPKETMDEVEELAFGVVQEYRESQKHRLKRTFVSGSDAANSKVNKKKGKFDREDPFKSYFIVVQLDWVEDEHPCNVLSRSAAFSKASCKWEQPQTANHDGMYECSVVIDDRTLSTAVEESKAEAKKEAARKAVDFLSKKCYTIRIKNKYLSEKGSVIDSQELLTSKEAEDSAEDRIKTNSVGHKLLKLMGWTGGGLGKDGSGIAEPVTAASMRSGRTGLGASEHPKAFLAKIRRLIEDYAKSDNPYDLVFSTGFDNEQRKQMHTIARRLGLKSKSFGRDEDRFITITRKSTGRQLLERLLKTPDDEKYTIISPAAT